jgi:hypothetical protein
VGHNSSVAPLPQKVFYAIALAMTGALAVAVYIVPLNANDFLKHLFKFETWGSVWRTFEIDAIIPHATLPDWRPIQRPMGHLLYLLAKGHEHLMFKGLLAISVAATAWLLIRLMPVKMWADAVAASIALLILFSHQSFAGAVEAVYPFGVEIILVMCELAVLGILIRERTVAGDVVAVGLALFAILLNEKGGIVGATYITGSALRMPGGSVRGAAWLFVAYVALLVLRFGYLRTVPALFGRSEGTVSPLDVAAPALNILISDPRFGQFRTIPQAFAGAPWAVVMVVSSGLTLAAIIAWATRTDRQELKVLALLVVALLASCVFGLFSRKDYIPIMALPLYAIVSFYALRWLFAYRQAALALGAILVITWGIRFAGLGYHLAGAAHAYQVEWRNAEKHGEAHEHDSAITTPLIARMQADILSRTFPDPAQVLSPAINGLFRYTH